MQKPHTPFEQGQGAGELPWEQCSTRARKGQMALSAGFFGFPPSFFLGYRRIVHPPSDDEGTERTWFEPEQRPRKRVQSMASNPRKGKPERFGAKTTSHDGKAGHLLTHVCHRARQEQWQVRPCKRRSSQSYVEILPP